MQRSKAASNSLQNSTGSPPVASPMRIGSEYPAGNAVLIRVCYLTPACSSPSIAECRVPKGEVCNMLPLSMAPTYSGQSNSKCRDPKAVCVMPPCAVAKDITRFRRQNSRRSTCYFHVQRPKRRHHLPPLFTLMPCHNGFCGVRKAMAVSACEG